jgi:hypothetical protein
MQYEVSEPTATFNGGKVKGCSGSPVVDERGRVIGFLTSSFNDLASFKTDGDEKSDDVHSRASDLEKHTTSSVDSNYSSYFTVVVLCKVPALLNLCV